MPHTPEAGAETANPTTVLAFSPAKAFDAWLGVLFSSDIRRRRFWREVCYEEFFLWSNAWSLMALKKMFRSPGRQLAHTTNTSWPERAMNDKSSAT
jgi:hypothetical protein